VNHRLARAITVALALSSSGCALTFDSQHLGVPATMAEPAQAPATGTAFHVTKHPVYLLMGLIPMAQPNLEDILGGQVANGTSIANLRIRVRARWSDLLITAFTAGIVSPRSVTFEGLVVKR
jgi:hypothetical protein